MPTDLQVPLEQLMEPHDAMRLEMDDEQLDELLDSIRREGVLSRLWIIHMSDYSVEQVAVMGETPEQTSERVKDLYEVRAGHRRFICCKQLDVTPVPCTLFTREDAAYGGLMLTENLIRADTTDFEQGIAFANIADTPGITEEELQRRCRKKLSYIYDRINLVKGDENIALAVHRGQISFGVAKKLNQIRYPAPGQTGEKFVGEQLENAKASAGAYRASFLERAILGGCTIEVATSWVSQWRQSAGIVVTSGQPAMEPMPAQGFALPSVTCALCGESDEPHKFETVSIHRNELALIRAGMRGETQAS
jgi:ParB/RepB/Spo0J family partition protein